MTCRRCNECVGMTHHWLPDPLAPDDDEWEPGDYACKHCDTRGTECEDCSGFGTPAGEAAGMVCGACMGEGVVPLTAEEYAHAMQCAVEVQDRPPCPICGYPTMHTEKCDKCAGVIL